MLTPNMNLEKAKENLSVKDAILENPKELMANITILENEGCVDDAKVLLQQGYTGVLEILYELWNWLSLLSDDPDTITEFVQENVKKSIIQNYDRQKLLPLANNPNTVSETLKWLYEMIESPVWRQAIYELAELPQNDACPFLSMTMMCMAFNDKYLGELSVVPKAWSEMSTLMRCVSYLLEPLLSMARETAKVDRDNFLRMKEQFKGGAKVMGGGSAAGVGGSTGTGAGGVGATGGGGSNSEQSSPLKNRFQSILYHNLNGFLDMGCYSEHTYLIIQSLLQCLDKNTKYHLPKHLSRLLEEEAINRCHDAVKYSVFFRNSRDYPEAMNAMKNILIKKELLMEDVNQLYTLFNSDMPPPAELLKITFFVDLLADSLFVSEETLLPEQQVQFSFLMSYASVVEEFYQDENRTYCNKALVSETQKKIEESSKICRQWTNTSGGGLSIRSFRDLPLLLDLIKSRPVAYGCFRFLIKAFESKRSDFELNMEALRPYSILVNELASSSRSLHPKLLRFLTSLLSSSIEGMEDLRQLDYKRCVIDMLINLFCEGHGVHVINAMNDLLNLNKADISLVRYFVVDLLNICQPPYTEEFMNAFEPLVSNPDIQNGVNVGRDSEAMREFLDHCQNHMISSRQG